MILSYLIAIFSFGLTHSAPQRVKTEGILAGEEMVIRLILHVQKTEKGAQLVVDLEDNSDGLNQQRFPVKTLASINTDMPFWKKKENKTDPTENNFRTKSAIVNQPLFRPKFISPNVEKEIKRPVLIASKNINYHYSPIGYQERPKLEFKISVGSNKDNRVTLNGVKHVTSEYQHTLQTTTPMASGPKIESTTTELTSTEDTTDNEALEAVNVNKAVADEGFGVLASRCSSFAPGLISDGAGGCTKPANRLKKKSYQNPYSFRSAERNELHSDLKNTPTENQENLETATT